MRGYGYNDYELLYLIHTGCEEALDVMFKKYQGLIVNTINSFHIVSRMFEDFYQEGMMVLFKAIKYFREDKKMSFTNFFTLLLKHRYIDLLRLNEKDFNNQILVEDPDILGVYVLNEETLEYEPDLEKLSGFEKEIYQMHFIDKKSITEIATELNLKEKQVYSARSRIKSKLKNK